MNDNVIKSSIKLPTVFACGSRKYTDFEDVYIRKDGMDIIVNVILLYLIAGIFFF